MLRDKQGVCQDFAHVTISLCRALKIPALYVSGYLATENASATHAWMEVLIPGVGWRSLDPTHNRQTDENYIKIAVGRDYADVPPVTGNYKGTTQRQMQVQVGVGAQFPVYRRVQMAVDLRGNGGGSTMIVRPTAALIYNFR